MALKWARILGVGVVLAIVAGCGEQPPRQDGSALPKDAIATESTPILPSSVRERGAQPVERRITPGERVTDDRMVWTWGRAGAGMPLSRSEAEGLERVGSLTKIVAVAAGLEHGLALDVDGNVWIWSESTAAIPAPPARKDRKVDGLSHVVAIAAGDNHSLVLRADGTVWAWGHNQHGQLGDGTNETRSSPVPVVGLRDVVSISAGSTHNLAVLGDGTVRAWGLGTLGRLGTGDHDNRNVAVAVPVLVGITAVAAGGNHSLAVGRDGTIWSWGHALVGDVTELGGVHVRPVPVKGIAGAVAVAAGRSHSLALTADGQVWAWGYNSFGELGDHWSPSLMVDGSDWVDVARSSPHLVPGVDGVVAIAAGEHHSLALRSDGSLWAWGSNTFGELGSSRSREPIYRAAGGPVPGLHGVSAIAARGVHSLAVLKSAGRALPSPQFSP